MSGIGDVETKFCQIATPKMPMVLSSGEKLSSVTLAYETYGNLNENKDNAVIVFHALTGSQHAAGINKNVDSNRFWTEEMHKGWWDGFIGPGKAIDTDFYFVVCSNYLGGCYGSTGPSSIDPKTGNPYGRNFPDITVDDMLRAQIGLLDYLGINSVLAAIGGSLGGMLAMDMACQSSDHVRAVISLASSPGLSALSRLHNLEQIFALQNDPNFNGGDYYGEDNQPYLGLVLARMIAMKSFISLADMKQRAKRKHKQDRKLLQDYIIEHPLESYILYNAKKFAKRFDTNSYLKILKAQQKFDLARSYGRGKLDNAMRKHDHRYLIVSIDSDTCFYPEEQLKIVQTLIKCKKDPLYVTIHSDKGHDSFLLEPHKYGPLISHMLAFEFQNRK